MNKIKTIGLSLLFAALCVPAIAQVPVTLTPADPLDLIMPPQPAVDSLDASLNSTVQADTIGHVREAIRNTDRLGPVRKVFVLTRLRNRSIQNAVSDRVISEGLSKGAISLSIDPDTQEVVQAIDIDKLIELIERLLPLIIQIIGLFGSLSSNYLGYLLHVAVLAA